jgi:hypothetical protein
MNFGTRGCMYCEGECNKECLLQEEPKAERMYSEEEALELLHSRMRYTLGEDYKEMTTIEWFEQQKKK